MTNQELRAAIARLVSIKRELTKDEDAKLDRLYAEQERRRQRGQKI